MVKVFGGYRIATAILMMAACFGLAGILWAQGITTGSIAGTISDPHGAMVPQATVTAVQNVTGAQFHGATGADGSFALHDLPIGIYTVAVESSGFVPLKVTSWPANTVCVSLETAIS